MKLRREFESPKLQTTVTFAYLYELICLSSQSELLFALAQTRQIFMRNKFRRWVWFTKWSLSQEDRVLEASQVMAGNSADYGRCRHPLLKTMCSFPSAPVSNPARMTTASPAIRTVPPFALAFSAHPSPMYRALFELSRVTWAL